MEEKVFDKIKLGFQQRISGEFVRSSVESVYVPILDEYVVIIQGYLLGQSSLNHLEVKFPLDWWQAFKERFFSDWMLKIWPVRYTKVVIDVDAIYPELHKKLNMPGERHFYNIRTSYPD